jgi:MFS family permease
MTERRSVVPAPLRRPAFRLLWLGWSISYAGDALQLLAQTWLIAVMTGSALAVAASPVLASLPLLLLPAGGVIADAFDRRRLLLVVQLTGAVVSGLFALLVATGDVAVWHIYAWVVFASLLRVVARPAYKALLTDVVPPAEARPAMALSSMTETGSMVLVTGAGAFFLSAVGLTAAFVVNTLTYLVAAWALWHHRQIRDSRAGTRLSRAAALSDLRAGFRYLRGHRAILWPLALTFAFVLATSPLFTLLAAVVRDEGKDLVDLGLLAAATSAGTFLGAAYAGVRPTGGHESMRYAELGLIGALALGTFALVPLGWPSMVPLVVVGSIFGAETVWNASRVAELADAVFQGRLQAITTMVLGVGAALAALWAGPVLDAFGRRGLVAAAIALGIVSTTAVVAITVRQTATLAKARAGGEPSV